MRVKPVIPKLRVAAWLGALGASASASASRNAERRVRMRPPSQHMVKAALRAANVARAHLAHRAFRAAGDLDIARTHDADLRASRSVRPNIAGAGDRDLEVLDRDVAGVH